MGTKVFWGLWSLPGLITLNGYGGSSGSPSLTTRKRLAPPRSLPQLDSYPHCVGYPTSNSI
jgi:hypothetical protein